MESIGRILLIQTAFIGDVILITPLIRAIKGAFSGCQLSVLLIPSTKEILDSDPRVDEVIVYDKRGSDRGCRNLLKMAKRLRERRFDLALIPHRSSRSAIVARLSGIPRRVGFRSSAGFFLLTDRVEYRKGKHEIERNLNLLSPLGVRPPVGPPELFPSSADFRLADDLLSRDGIHPSTQMVGISPGSVWPTKRWPWERFALAADELIARHGVRVVLLGSKEDQALCVKIARRMRGRPVMAAGKTSLLQSAALIQRCRILLSNDSAPAHMAVAVGTPVVAIFGPTVPEFGFTPFGRRNIVVQKKMSCRPCGPHGGSQCHRGTLACMREIGVGDVVAAVVDMLY